jgi:hypothetical protein
MCGCYPFTAAPEAVWRLFNSRIHSTDGASAGFILVTLAASFYGETGAHS